MRPCEMLRLAVAVAAIHCALGPACFGQTRAGAVRLTVNVPSDARIEVNGHTTRSTGTRREFISSGLEPGRDYRYEVRAVVIRNGRELAERKTVTLRSGEEATLSFDFQSSGEERVVYRPVAEPAAPSAAGETPPAPAAEPAEAPATPEVILASESAPPDAIAAAEPVAPIVATPVAARSLRERPLVMYLYAGNLAEAEEVWSAKLANTPDDDGLRFRLGVLQFLRGVEGLMQALYRHGLENKLERLSPAARSIPFVRLPVPDNPKPKPLSYDQTREIMQRFVDDLSEAAATLSAMGDGEVELPLRFGKIRLDVDADGTASDEEALWRVYARVANVRQVTQATAESFVICFDRADAHWLHAYCHLLMAMGEVYLAHDAEDLFESTAHLFFADPVSPYDLLRDNAQFPSPDMVAVVVVVDLIALVHLVNLPVVEPERMAGALEHLETMIEHSRKMWQTALAEEDNRYEWIPNPRQSSVVPGARVTQAMVDGWLDFLDEAEAILAGKKLIPFWRANDERGVNLRRVFTEPSRFDLVLWVQGTAAADYLEEGTKTDRRFWERLLRVFGGELFGYAIWFN
jgi:uncharacterized protein (TIGR03000 family)